MAADNIAELLLRSRELLDSALARIDDDSMRFLNDGITDEVAARRLSVSLRTYRRYVAELKTRLNVTTRFQLGVRLGLLDEQRRADA